MWLKWLSELTHKINAHWIRLHWWDYAKIWDKITAVKNITSSRQFSILKWSEHVISDIIVESQEWNWLWFSKKIIVSWLWDHKLNPQRFRKTN